MPYDSQGYFTRVMNWQEDAANAVPIVASRHDDEDDNFAQGFNEVVCRDGRAPMTGALKMGSFKITGMANGTTANDAVNKSQLDSVQTTLTTAINTKADDNAVVKLTGDQIIAGTKTFSASPIVPTVTGGDNSTKAASTAFVRGEIASFIPNWSNAVEMTFPYTATTDGWIVVQISKNNNNGYIKIDGKVVGRTMGSSGNWADSTNVQVPVASGSQITIEGSPSIDVKLFIPI